MPPDDKARLQHVLEAAQKAVRLTEKRKRADLDTDELLSLGVTRLLEIVGEAAAHVSETTRARHADVPWSQMIGMRNRLIHGYDVIDADVLWQTVTQDLPALIRALRQITRTQ